MKQQKFNNTFVVHDKRSFITTTQTGFSPKSFVYVMYIPIESDLIVAIL